MQETQVTRVRSLGRDDPLEEEMATHSSILAWRIPRTEEPGGVQSTGSHRVRHDWSDLARMHACKVGGEYMGAVIVLIKYLSLKFLTIYF